MVTTVEQIRQARRWFGRLSLSAHFALAGGVVMLAAAAIIGSWVTAIISRNVVSSTAGATALFMDSFIGPPAQDLDHADTLSAGPIQAIEAVLEGSALGKRVVSVKLWKPGGLIAYAENAALVGQRFEPTPGLERAFAGSIVSELDDLESDESASERSTGLPLLEIYSPIRRALSGEIIAVAEFYEDATELQQTLQRARLYTWLIVVALTLMIGAALFGVVRRGSVLISQQQRALHARIAEAEYVSQQNRVLRLRVERAAGRVAELNEQYLRRISADLHDGPAQLIGLAALRLGGLAKSRTDEARAASMGVVKHALDEAMQEIRNISAGLSLPEIDNLSLTEIIENVARAHERYTETTVTLDLKPLPAMVSQGLRICVFRFVQEGLNNAFRHAAGARQHVGASIDRGMLWVSVVNGPARGAAPQDGRRGLGLGGLRERVESLGGVFVFSAPPGQDACMSMTISLGAGGGDG